MELQDYAAALRRYWKTWVGLATVGVLAALAVVLFSTPSYQASSTVFVASTGDGTSGSQFVNQRVTSYPDIATSRAVLAPVIAAKGLDENVAALRLKVEASNPTDTSLIKIVVTDEDPAWAADTSNAIADQFRKVVEDLERPGTGDSPVRLTVTDRANVPTSPVYPVPSLLIAVGLVAGLSVGLAAAIIRSRRDTRLYREDDVRTAWGADADELPIFSTPVRRRRQVTLAPSPATLLSFRLESLAGRTDVQVVAVGLSPGARAQAPGLIDEVRQRLDDWDVPVTAGNPRTGEAPAPGRPGVAIQVAEPADLLQEVRRMTAGQAGVVLILEAGRCDRERLQEVRSLLDAVQAQVFAVVFLPRRTRRRTDSAAGRPSAAASSQRTGSRDGRRGIDQEAAGAERVGA